MTVSCGRGTLAPPAPPDEVDHEFVECRLYPDASSGTAYLVTAVVNVILVLLPQFPRLVPVHDPFVSVTEISLKLTYDNATVLAADVVI